MTGYGQADNEFEGGRISVEIQCINRKHLEFQFHMPKEWIRFEYDLRKIAQSIIRRGKVSVSINWERPQFPQASIEVDYELARQYYQALSDLNDDLELDDEIGLKHILQNRDIMKLLPVEVDLQVVQEVLETTAQTAIERAQEMRRVEGDFISKDIMDRIDLLESLIGDIEQKLPAYIDSFTLKLKEKISTLLSQDLEDDMRYIREIAYLSEKFDITEEVVRFQSHLNQFRKYFRLGEPVGKLMDFVLQEMNREVNTIASKSNDQQIVKSVIEMKNEIEKIREQVQNIE